MVNVYGFVSEDGQVIKPLTAEEEQEMKEDFPWGVDSNGEWKEGFWDKEMGVSEYVLDVTPIEN